MRTAYKRLMVVGLLLTFTFASGPVFAGTIESVMMKVNDEYLAKNIKDVVYRDNMILILNNADAATDCTEEGALMDAFRTLVQASLGDKVNQVAHDNLLAEASGVGGCP